MRRLQRTTFFGTGALLIVALLWLATNQQPADIAQAQAVDPVLTEPVATEPSPLLDQIIVQYIPAVNSRMVAAGEGQMAQITAVTGLSLTYFRELSGDAHVLKLPHRLTPAEAQAVAAQIETLPDVVYAEPDWRLQLDWTPNDPLWNGQWHYFAANGINLDSAWEVTLGNRGMVVAVLDTGLLLNHPDIVGRTVQGYDMVSDFWKGNDSDGRDNNPTDPGDWVTMAESTDPNGAYFNCSVVNSSWHGTHVAGTIAASINNNVGVAGISEAQILPVRVLGKCGGNLSDVVDGIRWAAGIPIAGLPNNTFPARLINMSLGWNEACADSLQSAINAARTAGAIVMASAGNQGIDAANRMPGNCAGVITVAATDQNGDRSVWGAGSSSNFGSTVEISAPGTAVTSTMNAGTMGATTHNYGPKNGTSMATPHVSGVVALTLSVRPTLNTEQLLDLLQYTAQGFPAGSSCNTAICGAGIIDAEAAVRDIFLIKGATGGLGLPSQPYGSLSETYNAAWNGARLNIAANNFAGSYTFNKELTLTAVGGSVIIGQP